jgi:hypothetical protein
MSRVRQHGLGPDETRSKFTGLQFVSLLLSATLPLDPALFQALNSPCPTPEAGLPTIFRGGPAMSRSPHCRQRSSIAHHPSRQRRPGPAPSAASGGRSQVVSLPNLQHTAGTRSSGPSIAATQSPRASLRNIPQYPYFDSYSPLYFGHP